MKLAEANLQIIGVLRGKAVSQEAEGLEWGACLFVYPDGATMATDGHSALLAEPPPEKAGAKVVFREGVEKELAEGEPTEPFRLSVDDVKETLRSLPKTKLLERRGVGIRRLEGGRAELITAGEDSEKRVTVWARNGAPDYSRAMKTAGRPGAQRLCMNRQKLIDLLTAMGKACPQPKEEDWVYMELRPEKERKDRTGPALMVRSVHQATGQRVLGLLSPAITSDDKGDNWPRLSPWERKVLGRPNRVRVKVRKLRRVKRKKVVDGEEVAF